MPGSGLVVIGYDRSAAAEQAVRESGALLAERPALVVTVWKEGLGFELMELPAARCTKASAERNSIWGPLGSSGAKSFGSSATVSAPLGLVARDRAAKTARACRSAVSTSMSSRSATRRRNSSTSKRSASLGALSHCRDPLRERLHGRPRGLFRLLAADPEPLLHDGEEFVVVHKGPLGP
jgi:hypothetical protein